MTERFLSVPTLIRGMFRQVDGPSSPHLYGGSLISTTAGMRDELLSASRLQDATARLLAEMDRKLDAVLALLQRESLVKDFPFEGHITTLSATALTLECPEKLAPGDCLELLLLLHEYPMRIVSVLARVDAALAGEARARSSNLSYALSINDVEADDREAIIQFVFGEERKRIRRRKDESQEHTD